MSVSFALELQKIDIKIRGCNSSDAMAQQEWQVVRRRRSSEGCNMLASPMARAATQGQDIPTRRVVITSEEDMPAGLCDT